MILTFEDTAGTATGADTLSISLVLHFCFTRPQFGRKAISPNVACLIPQLGFFSCHLASSCSRAMNKGRLNREGPPHYMAACLWSTVLWITTGSQKEGRGGGSSSTLQIFLGDGALYLMCFKFIINFAFLL